MATRRPKRKHRANATVKVHGLTKAGTSIELEIFAANKKVGKLIIGRGSLTWFGNHWKHGRSLSWSAFADHMDRE